MNSAKLRYLLRIVWEMGPCANRDIACEAGLSPVDCYVALYQLRQEGLVSHRPAAYDITPDGLKKLNVKPEVQPTLFE